MKVISIEDIQLEELMLYSQFFKGMSFQNCNQSLSYILKNDNNEFCGFAFARCNNIDLSCRYSEKMEITKEMNGCEILQIYTISTTIEALLLKRLYNRIFTWCDNGKSSFDYLWSESLSNYDFYSDILDCNKVTQSSNNEQKEVIYSKLKE